MIDWRVYYSDGSTFDSTQGAPHDATAVDVQAIVMRDPDPGSARGVGRQILSGKDYYYFEHGQWFSCDIFGLYDFLIRNGLVLFGRNVSDEKFEATYAKALTDPDFPPKSAFRDSEYQPEA